MRYSLLLLLTVALSLSACKRMHTETATGKQPSTQPAYSEKMQNPDPNQPGTSQ